MGAALKLEGQRFGRLVVVDRVGSRGKNVLWRCKCDCGNETDVISKSLVAGKTKSCGCFQRDRAKDCASKGGFCTNHPLEYNSWRGMRERCANTAHEHYHCYGGRGISYDPSWDSFEVFLSDMGVKPGPKYSLERIDNDGPYAPWNCKWATQTEQTNNKRNNSVLYIFGKRMTVAQVLREFGVSYTALRLRLDAGFPPELAATMIPRKGKPLAKRLANTRVTPL